MKRKVVKVRALGIALSVCMVCSSCITPRVVSAEMIKNEAGTQSDKETIEETNGENEIVEDKEIGNNPEVEKKEEISSISIDNSDYARSTTSGAINGINDTWTNPDGLNAAVNEIKDGKLNLKSGSGNTNTVKNSIFVNEDADVFKDGTITMDVTANSEAKDSRFGVYARYNDGKGVFVGYDASGWYWQVYDGLKDTWYTGTRVAALAKGETKTLQITLNGDKMNASLENNSLFPEVNISTVSDAGSLGLKVASWGAVATDMSIGNISYPGQEKERKTISGTVIDGQGNPLDGATVKIGMKTVSTTSGGAFQLQRTAGTYPVTITKEGYRAYTETTTVQDKDITWGPITLTKIPTAQIKSNDMTVTIAEKFPRVIDYKIGDKTFYGQTEELNTVTVNNLDITPEITSTIGADKATYVMKLKGTDAKDATNNVDATITAELLVDKNILTFQITKIEPHNGTIVKTIEIKDHHLVSVRSTQGDAMLNGANMSTNTHISGDRAVKVDSNLNVSGEAKKGYMYAFVSNKELSAGLWSNSENKVNADWQRVTATAKAGTNYKSIGLSSTYWTYQKTAEHRAEDGTIEYQNKAGSVAIDELPSTKVIITADSNEDGKVNWQDGAIAYRDIMNNPFGAEKVPDLAAYRISMNFGSQAQNPFLMTLDNVKKIYLHTDGLGQSILLKGYGSEGHDSGHLNYADIGTRIGGAEDMKTLLEKGAEFGATFGIHVNASETYPESKYFNEDILRRAEDGVTYSYGWNWIDQGININADYDLRNGRVDRWKDLYDALGGKDNKLDFIYVDVWGNGQSGDNGSWASRQLSKEIVGHAWRVGSEWGHANEYDSTFQHWAADLTYGGYKNKGINSTITRFIRNHQKDSWVGNYPSYGGEAETPLLGGMNMKDFEGWQGRSDYAAYIYNLFEVNLSSKFTQHFKVTNWEDGTPIDMSDNGEAYKWTPGMKAVLKDDDNRTLKIERKSNDYANDKDGYRTRTMTFEGKKIYEGQEGDTSYLIPWFWDATGEKLKEEKLYHWNTKGGETTWEVPASWSNLGTVQLYSLNELGKEKVKDVSVVNGKITINAEASTPYVIYKGQPTQQKVITWSEGMHIVDSGFNSGSLKDWTVKGAAEIFKSQGSNPMLKIADNKEKVTLTQTLTDLKPNTNYAVYVGVDNRSKAKAGMEVNVDGKVSSNDTTISIAKNYIKAYAHNTNKATSTINDSSYFQNMYVFFKTGATVNNVTLTLFREPGDGATYFDDIRICENKANNWEKWDSEQVFTQNFEEVAQGIYPFVIGNIENVEDNRTHLSERHEPYTQRGWNGKVVDDVIDGTWSLKTNGLVARNRLVYQTIPQNFEFEPGQSYMIQFDYEAGGDNTYSFVTGDGSYLENGTNLNIGLASTATKDGVEGKKKTFYYNLVASDSGLSWFGIYSNDIEAYTQRVKSDKQISFNGYNDFMLDNLVITKTSNSYDKKQLFNYIKEAEKKIEIFYTKESWDVFRQSYEKAVKLHNSVEANQSDIDLTARQLKAALLQLKELQVTKAVLSELIEKNAKYNEKDYSTEGWLTFVVKLNYAKAAVAETNPKQIVLQKAYQDLILAEMDLKEDDGPSQAPPEGIITSEAFEVKAGSEQPGGGGEGLAEYAVDNDPGTIWHTAWSGTERKNMWFEFDFNEPETVKGVRYMRRNGGGNGQIDTYKIQISTDNGASYQEVKAGEWKREDGWQEVVLDEVKNVTNLKIFALTSQGDFASAAEFAVVGTPKLEQAAPTGIQTVDTKKDEKNGKLIGVTSAMEYSTSLTKGYKACEGTEVSNLEAGNYYVRMAATKTHKASLPSKVTVFIIGSNGELIDPDKSQEPSQPDEDKPSGGGDSWVPGGSSGTPTETPDKGDSNTTVKKDETATEKIETTTTVKEEADGSKTTNIAKVITNKSTGAVTEVKSETKTNASGSVSNDITINNETVNITSKIELDKANKVTSSKIEVKPSKAETKVTNGLAQVTISVEKELLQQITDLLKESTGTTIDGKELNMNVVLPKTDLVTQLTNGEIKNVQLSVTVPHDKVNVILPKEAIEAAKKAQKDVKTTVKDSDGAVVAIWDLPGTLLANSSAPVKDLNLAVNVNNVDSTAKQSKVVEQILERDNKLTKNDTVILSFAQDGKLPGSSTVTINVAKNNNIKAGKSVYLLWVNPETTQLEYVPNTKCKVSKAGTVTLNVMKGNEYVLVTKKPSTTIADSLTKQIDVTIKGKPVQNQTVKKGNTIKLGIELPDTIKKVDAIDKTDKDKAMAQAKVTYKSGKSSVATVSKTGTITAKKAGTATIKTTIQLSNGKKKVVNTKVTVK